MSDALLVIPTFMSSQEDFESTVDAVKSVHATQPQGVEVLCVDDKSPGTEWVDRLEERSGEIGCEVIRKDENSGFSKTVNVGLRRALQEGRDAILMNADVEVTSDRWLRVFKSQQDKRHNPAAVVGAMLLYPNGTIQHAGIYFSLMTRTFDHLYKYAPPNLKEANRTRVCPVTGAFQFIRHSTLEKVGLYDEQFLMGWEDVDYCLRVMLAEEQCVFTPQVRAYHFEYMFRGKPSEKIKDWQARSFYRLVMKYAEQNFAGLVPQW